MIPALVMQRLTVQNKTRLELVFKVLKLQKAHTHLIIPVFSVIYTFTL